MSAQECIACPISDAELARRWALIRSAMAARGLDALLLRNDNDWLGGGVKYLTDLPATNGYPRTVLFFADAPMSVIEMGAFGARRDLGGRDPLHRGVGLLLGAPSFSAVHYSDGYDAALAVAELRAHGSRRLGLVAPGYLPAKFSTILQDAFPGAAGIEDATDWFDAIKAVKSAEEIALIRRAAALQDQVFASVLGAIRPGLRDCDITHLAQTRALELGSEQGIFLGGSAPIGRASSFVPRHQQGRTLQQGDHLSLLIEVNGPGGFYTEIARTIVLGRASAQLQDGFAAVRAAQQATLATMRPGVPARAIAAAHDRFMVARGLPPETRLYAHGQGYDMVERPLIRADEPMALAENMCLAVHPGFENDQIFAVICDNYLIGADGPSACLHQTEKRLFEL